MEPSTIDAVSRFSVTGKDRQTENPRAVEKNDSNKSPPLSPPRTAGEAGPEPPRPSNCQDQSESQDLQANSGSGADLARPDASLATEAKPATGSAGQAGSAAALEPVTFALFWKHYSPHRPRNERKAEEAWADMPDELRLWSYAILPQYFAHCARIAKKPQEAWQFLRLKIYRQYPLPRAGAPDPKEPEPRVRPPDADQVLASPLGLRAAEDGWAADLHDFVRTKGRLPEFTEERRLEDMGIETTAKYLEALGSAHHPLAPYANGFLEKRWRVTQRAFAANDRPQPTFDEFLKKPRALIARGQESIAPAAMPSANPLAHASMPGDEFADAEQGRSR